MEKVSAYHWKSGKLKGKKASGYTRSSKPKKHIGVHRAETVPVKLIRFRDNQGRVVRQQTMIVKSDI